MEGETVRICGLGGWYFPAMNHSKCWAIGRVDGPLHDGIFQEGTIVTQVRGVGCAQDGYVV